MNTINLNHALRATRTAELHFTAYTRYLPAAAELARQLPASEESDFCNFKDEGENGDILHHYSRRNRHLEESLIRLMAASMLWTSYRCTAAPEAAEDADKVKQQLDRLREIVEEHIDIYGITLTPDVGICVAADEVVETAR